MKKLLAVLSIALLVVGAVTIFSMAEDTAAPGPSAPTAPAQTASPSAVGSGAVYYLNFKPEQSQQWQALAKTYTEQTGVPVTVVTAASGTYENTLRSELEKADAPTLFQVNGPVGLKTWRDYCLDLRDTALYRNLKSDDFALIEDGQVLGVAYVIETYGLICNRTLLDKYMAMDAAREDLAVGHTPVSWTFPTMPSEAWKNGVGAALLEYAQGTKEWSAVETAFVDGWASEYAAAQK